MRMTPSPIIMDISKNTIQPTTSKNISYCISRKMVTAPTTTAIPTKTNCIGFKPNKPPRWLKMFFVSSTLINFYQLLAGTWSPTIFEKIFFFLFICAIIKLPFIISAYRQLKGLSLMSHWTGLASDVSATRWCADTDSKRNRYTFGFVRKIIVYKVLMEAIYNVTQQTYKTTIFFIYWKMG